MGAMAGADAWYAGCLPKGVVGGGQIPGHYGEFGKLAGRVRFIERNSRKLARNMFYAMGKYQARLEKKGHLLGRFVDIGAELYAISCACVRAHSMKDEPHGRDAQRLADVFSRRARMRIRRLFSEIHNNADDSTYRVALDVLKGKYAWLEEGAIQAWSDEPPATPTTGGSAADGTTDKRAPLSDTRVATQVGAGA
jgi:hypothetical protein